jgi:UV DNA damage endonuclease
MNLGYCCINMSLRDTKPEVYSSRSINRKNFSIDKVSELSVLNCRDILTILQWNESHNIKTFRIGSEPLPRASDPTNPYCIGDLKDASEIRDLLAAIGTYAHTHNHNISFHPGQYVCLASPTPSVIDLAVLAVEKENEVADAICRDVHIDIPINIHIGGSYGNEYESTADRFINTFHKLSPSLQKRLVVENDDKRNGWSVPLLYDMIYKKIGIPITFDFHHYLFCNRSDIYTLQDEFLMAYSTWNNRSAQVHYSESPTDKLVPKHSDYYKNPLPDWLAYYNCHIHLECKAKELALLQYREQFYNDSF